MSRSADESGHEPRAGYQLAGLVLGPVFAVIIALFFRPDTLSIPAVMTAAIAIWMAIWWATEAVPVAVTAILPLVLFPMTGVMDFNDTASRYSHWIIWLFFGGFIMALTIERWGLHRRIALAIFSMVGTSARALVGGFMVAGGFVSMWISNTSTTMMLLPIIVSVIAVINETSPHLTDTERKNFGLSMMLGLAYGATIGGMSTLVGTPPNAFMAGFMQDTYGVEIGFATWMMVGVPIALILMPLAWVLLTRFIYPVSFGPNPATADHLESLKKSQGKMSQAERRTAIIFVIMVLGWLSRKWLNGLPGLGGLTDALIAVGAAIALLTLPAGTQKRPLLSWDEAVKLPWGVLILFGGGLALAGAFTSSGLAQWIGGNLSGLAVFHLAVLVVASTLLVIFLTELTSNLATAATFLPVMGAIAIQTGHNPLVFIIPVTLAASCAFMLPVATPPNAIVFGSGLVTIPQMIRSGIVMNLIGVVVLSVAALTLAPMIFGG